MQEIENEIRNLLIKVLIPALVAVSIKIAIDSRNKTVSVFNIIASIVTGVGMAYLFSGLILSNFSNEWIPLMIALVAISGEKLGNWVIYKFNVDTFIETLIEKYYKK
jgi:hypothetical protein